MSRRKTLYTCPIPRPNFPYWSHYNYGEKPICPVCKLDLRSEDEVVNAIAKAVVKHIEETYNATTKIEYITPFQTKTVQKAYEVMLKPSRGARILILVYRDYAKLPKYNEYIILGAIEEEPKKFKVDPPFATNDLSLVFQITIPRALRATLPILNSTIKVP